MAEVGRNAYATTGANVAAGTPTVVAVVNDGTGDRQIMIVGDQTTAANLQTVKAASTAAVAGDMAAVVALHPTSPLPTGSNTIGALTANQSVNNAQVNGVTVTTGNGVSGTGVQRVTLASDSTGQVTLATGSNTIGKVTAGSSTTGGLTTHTLISAATTNATSVKASAGTLYSIQASNTGAGVAFLKLFNKASAPTVGTDTAVKTLIIPAAGGIVVSTADIGIAFGTGIAYSITAVATTADTTAVALNQVVVNLDYV